MEENPTDTGSRPPRPYLTRDEVTERMRTLGFIIGPESLNYPAGYQKPQFTALQELLAGAIAEWVGFEFNNLDEDDPFYTTAPQAVAEMSEWTEEWLVG